MVVANRPPSGHARLQHRPLPTQGVVRRAQPVALVGELCCTGAMIASASEPGPFGSRADPSDDAASAGLGDPASDAPLVKLVQLPSVWGMNASPSGLALETWLRLAGVPFQSRSSINIAKAPNGRLPFIVDHGREIGDGSLAIEHLKRTRGIDPDSGLGARARAESVALQRLLEEHLHGAIQHSRWVDPEGWASVRAGFFASVPWLARPLARREVRGRMRASLRARGTGRLGQAQVYDEAARDLDALAAMLADRPFFAGDQLTTIDAIAFGALASILRPPIETELKRRAAAHRTLVAWCETMEAGLYGEG